MKKLEEIPFEYLECPICEYIPQKGETMNVIKDGGIAFGFIFRCNNCGEKYNYYPLDNILKSI